MAIRKARSRSLGRITRKPRIWVCRNRDHPWNYRYGRISLRLQLPSADAVVRRRDAIIGGKGCYRQLSAKPSNPSGLQEDYRPYDRRVRAFPASAGRQNRVYGSATTRFRRTGSILPGRFQFLGNGNGRLAGDCGLHQPVSQIWVPSSRPPVLSMIGVTPSVRTGGNTTTPGSREGRGLTTKCDANQLAA